MTPTRASPRRAYHRKTEPESRNRFLQKTLNAPRLSDLSVVTAAETFKVHKMVLCSQSDFFDRLFRGNWKETADNIVSLKEDDPEAIKYMIQHMYGFEYHSDHRPSLSTVFIHLKAYQVGVKYAVHALEKDSLQGFVDTINQIGIVGKFSALVPEVYSRTIIGDRELRNAVVDISYREVKVLAKMGGFADILEDYPDYAIDLLKKYVVDETM